MCVSAQVALLEGGALSTTLAVKNTGDAPLSFTCALHTYFRVADLPSVRVSAEVRGRTHTRTDTGCCRERTLGGRLLPSLTAAAEKPPSRSGCHARLPNGQGGLSGAEYLDNLDKRARVAQPSADVAFDREVDRIYLATPDRMTLAEGSGRVVRVDKRGLPDSVVWNPWVDKAKALADFGARKGRNNGWWCRHHPRGSYAPTEAARRSSGARSTSSVSASL